MENKEAPTYRTEDYDIALADKAASRITKLALGNGYNSKDVSQSDLRSYTYVIEALTIISFEGALQEKKKKPKKDIPLIDVTTYDEAQALTKEKIHKYCTDSSFKESLKTLFTHDKNLGFGEEHQNIPINRLSNHYKMTQECGACAGRGRVICPSCSGRKQSVCGTCGGQRRVLCDYCNGQGHMPPDQNGNRALCPVCNGERYVQCPTCKGQGIVYCGTCNGEGTITCENCKGRGVLIHYAENKVTATATDILNTNDMPENLRTLINKIGLKRLLGGSHIQMKSVSMSPERYIDKEDIEDGLVDKYAYHFPPILKPNEVHLHYELKIPYAELSIALKEEELTAKLIGFRGIIADMPAFLNNAVSRETIALEKKLKEKKLKKENFLKELNYRFLEKAWALLKSHKPKKAMALFAKEYGAAIDKEYIFALFKTLKTIGQSFHKGRRAMVLGIILAVVIGLGIYTYTLIK